MRCLFERDFEVVAQVGATVDVGTTAATAAGPAAEDLVENAAEGIGEAVAAATETAAHAGLLVDAGMAVLVIGGPLLAIREDFVGFLGFLEFFLGRRIVRVAVGVMLHGHLAVGLLDLVVGSVAVDAENLVKIAFRHCFYPSSDKGAERRRKVPVGSAPGCGPGITSCP